MARRDGPISFSVDNLLGGVSQQPNTVRADSQCEVQDNAYSSVVDGLGKRQPTEHIHTLTKLDRVSGNGLTEDAALVHWIDRDDDERYTVIVDSAYESGTTLAPGLKIFDLNGSQITVTGRNGDETFGVEGAAIRQYLRAYDTKTYSAPNAKRDCKILTVADTSFILNKTVKCKMSESAPPWDGLALSKDATSNLSKIPKSRKKFGTRWYVSKSARRWFLFQRTANPLSRYAVEFRTKTSPEYINTPGFESFWDPPRKEDTDFEKNDRSLAWVKTFGLDYERRPATTPIRGYGKSDDVPPYDPASNKYEGYQIPTVQTHEVVRRLWEEWAHLAGTGVPGGEFAYYRGGILDNYNRRKALLEQIGALVVSDGIYSPRIGNTDFVRMPQIGPVLMIELKYNSGFGLPVKNFDYRESISCVVDSTGDLEDSLTAFSTEVSRLSQLPLQCKDGHIVKITGLEDNDSDEFYAVFKANSEEHLETILDPKGFRLVDGHWEESLAPLVDYRIDNETMPLKLTRKLDKNENVIFELTLADWTDRKVGDDDSNPHPGFIDSTIEDVFLWRNRLGLLSGSRVLLSEADEYENFWRTTVKVLKDSDPIDIDAGHGKVANLRYATPLEEELIIWTDRTQFVMQADPILTPKTAGLTPATEFEAFPDVAPETIDSGIFYGLESGGGGFSQVRQYHRIAETSGSFSSRPSTEHVPRYIPGKIAEMTASSQESVMCVRTDDEDSKHIIYVYKWADASPGQRVLSSWSRYILGFAGGGTVIHGMHFFEDDLYLVVQRWTNGQGLPIQLEKITFSGQRQVDTGSSFRCLLDRRITEADCTFEWRQADRKLRIILPRDYWVQSTNATELAGMKIVSRTGTGSGPEAEQFSFEHEVGITSSVLLVDDPTQELWDMCRESPNSGGSQTFLFYIGQDYTMTYEFSRPNIREVGRDGRPSSEIITGRLQLLRGHISCEDTGYMKVEVAPALHANGTTIVDRDTWTHHWPVLQVGLGSSYVGVLNIRDGRMTFGLRSKPEHLRLIITNDSPYPSNPKKIDYEAIYSRRSRMTAF